jgi:hypothetical protein
MRPGFFLRPFVPVVAAFVLLGPASSRGEAPPPAPPAAPPAADTPALPDASTYQAPDPMPLPPGAPADQALWRKALDEGNSLSTVRAEAAKLQWRAHNGKYETRLTERAKGKSEAEAARLKEVARKVQAAWDTNHALTTNPWPVDPTRGCQYQALQLESAMNISDGPEKSAMMAPAKEDVNRCIEAAEAILGRMRRSNQDLDKALVEAEAALAPVAAPTTK